MTSLARGGAVALGAIVLACAAWITLAPPLGEEYVPVLGELTQDEIRKAEMVLGAAGLGDFHVANYRLQVPSKDKAKYLQALGEGGAVPAQSNEIIQDSLQFNLLEPQSMRRVKQEAAREQALATKLRALPQVDSASVEYDEVQGGFGKASVKVCSIQVQQQGNKPIAAWLMHNIAEHATKHFAGLRIEDVSVLDSGTGNLFQPGDHVAITESRALAAKTRWEEHYRELLDELLSRYGEYSLAVSVAFPSTAPEFSSVAEEKQAEVDTLLNRSSSQSLTADWQGANAPQSIQEKDRAEQDRMDQEEPHEVVPKLEIAQSRSGNIPASVTVSIGIPDSFYTALYNRRKDETTAPPVELDRLRTEVDQGIIAAVEATLVPADAETLAHVTVYQYPAFVDSGAEQLVTEESSLIAQVSNLSPVYWGLSAGCFLVSLLLGFVIVWKPRLARRSKSLDYQESDEIALGVMDQRSQPDPPSAEQRVSDWIKENPTQSAELLQSWARREAA